MNFRQVGYVFSIFAVLSCAQSQQKAERKQKVDSLLSAGRSMPDVYRAQPSLNLSAQKLWNHFPQQGGVQCVEEKMIETAVPKIVVNGEIEPAPKFLTWVDDRYAVFVWFVKRDGIQVRDAYVEATFYKKGEICFLREITDHSLSSVSVASKTAPAESDFAELTGLDFELQESRVVYFLTDKGLQQAREWRASQGDEIVTVTAVGHEESDIKEAYNNRFHVERNVYMEAYEDSYLEETPTKFPAPFLSMGDGLFTDAEGLVDDGNLVELRGQRVTVVNPNGSVVQVEGEEQADGSLLVPMAAPLDSELHTYIGLNRMARFALRHLKEEDTSLLTRSIQVTAKQADANGCNAYYQSTGNPTSGVLVFFARSNQCVNTALLLDVIAHEWCHGLHDATGQPGIRDGAASEGLADTCASYLRGSPEMGKGFFIGNDNLVREVNTDRVYPDDVPANGQVHTEGQIIGSTFWSLREEMIKVYGDVEGPYLAEKLFFQHLLTTNTYLDAYRGVLRVDDDDGDPMTQSPNHCLITNVFLKHGLAEANDLPNDCKDVGQVTMVPVNSDMKVSIEIEDTDAVFHVAGPEIAEVILCEGDKGCEKEDGTSMKVMGKKDGLDFFQQDVGSYEEGSYVSFMIYGYYGEPTMKVMKVVKK